ncbi:ATP-dependent translocase ABCB1-like [Tubulanus polymorphus]|uniref:ATP-dependent translocase ABCB1-like n=1 Tax=Tubulanus polymorphus TaxID=672921 RepID=UPI003DA1F9FD
MSSSDANPDVAAADADIVSSSNHDDATIDISDLPDDGEEMFSTPIGTSTPAHKNHSLKLPSAAVAPPEFNELNDDSIDTEKIAMLEKTENEENKEDPEQPEKGKEKVVIRRVGMFEVFRFADKTDVLLMVIGALCAVAQGCAFPVNLLIYGEVADIFVNNAKFKVINGTNSTFDSIPRVESTYDLVWPLALYFCVIGACVLVLAYVSITFWSLAAERQTKRIRRRFFQSILRQDIAWFDLHRSGELNSRLTEDIHTIHNGIGDKVATYLQWTTGFVAGFLVGFVKGWKLTLVILSTTPLIALGGALMGRALQRFTAIELKAYSLAGAIAEEVLGAIRTVKAFGGAEKEEKRYSSKLVTAKNIGIRKTVIMGIGHGYMHVVLFSSFGLAFWYGGKLVREEDFKVGNILQVFLGVLIGAISLGNGMPNLEAFSNARGAAVTVYDIINQQPSIDSDSKKGSKPKIEGNVEFEDVGFSYPSRPECQVLKDVSFNVKVGQTVALVGSSGCGKSTIVQLLQRFYDVQNGAVKIDGVDVRDMNIDWLRRHVGVVSQEPVLFAATIAENIRLGCLNGSDGEDERQRQRGAEGENGEVTQEMIEKAAAQAHVHDFIMTLPEKYETLVGERGARLSGGQKQRVAIARALIRDPKILLLDEATSALDLESEAIVQEALEEACQGRTTIVVAHRLSTVKNADLIIALKDGAIVETGTHEKLMSSPDGLYHQLVINQVKKESKSENESESSDEDDDDNDDDEIFSTPIHSVNNEVSPGKPHHRQQTMLLSPGKQTVYSSYHSLPGLQPDPVTEQEQQTQEEEGADVSNVSMLRLLTLNSKEWPFIAFGCLAAMITGGVHPAFAIIFSELLGVFALVDLEVQSYRTSLYSGLLAAIGVTSGIFQFLSTSMFAVSGESLTFRLRRMAFGSMLRQEIAWFDAEENQVGALASRLALDASHVKGATGARFGVVFQSFANLGVGIIISFIFGWKLTLVILLFLPLMAAGGMLQTKLMTGFAKADQPIIEQGAKIAVETISNVRIVTSLNKQQYFIEKYSHFIDNLYHRGIKRAHVYGISYSFTQAVIFFAYAASFAYGSYLVDRGEMVFIDIFKIFSAITFGGMAFGRASSAAPDYGKAKVAAANLFRLFDRVPTIDSGSTQGAKLEDSEFTGQIQLQNVNFRYPTRPNVRVLRHLDLTVKSGQVVALVGSSGCGKSTVVQLIERFYDPLVGQVVVDGYDAKDLNLSWLRSRIGVVSQEPVLFATSIKENIAYGDNTRNATIDEVIDAAKRANIHNFIQSLPLGYETDVGDKGTQLSGGQKQRVAIARALIRDPKILLLDEATSALDAENERIVQGALNDARVGRTCIVVAHRLSTIREADAIVVLRHGRVVESGTHDELIKQRGVYYKLYSIQN